MKFRHCALADVLFLVACGGDDDAVESGSGETTTTVEETTTTATTAETTTTAAATGAIDGPDAEAAAAAVATAFDSSVPFEEKVALIEGGEAHRADHDAYLGAANAVGGITVQPTAVVVDGDTATVTYGVSFAGSPVYGGLDMVAVRSGNTWIVPTTSFCDFLAAARTPCSA